MRRKCKITGRQPAKEIHSRLTGTAWKAACTGAIIRAGTETPFPSAEDYFLEDLGIFLSVIGVVDTEKKRIVLPNPGDTTVLIAPGDYGSRVTSTYKSYEWKVVD